MLTDLQGRILFKDELEAGNDYQFQLPAQKGIYLIHLIQEDQQQSLRLIKE